MKAFAETDKDAVTKAYGVINADDITNAVEDIITDNS